MNLTERQWLLVEEHEGLIQKVIEEKVYWALFGYKVDRDDLWSEGRLGLINAAWRFDPSFDVAFSTYAFYWIWNSLRNFAVRNCSPVSMPVNAFLTCNVHREQAFHARRSCRISQLVRRLDGVEQLERPDPTAAVEVERYIDVATVKEVMALVMKRLPERQRTVVRRRVRGDTLTQIAGDLGITREGARQVEARAMQRLRKLVRREFPQFYFYETGEGIDGEEEHHRTVGSLAAVAGLARRNVGARRSSETRREGADSPEGDSIAPAAARAC